MLGIHPVKATAFPNGLPQSPDQNCCNVLLRRRDIAKAILEMGWNREMDIIHIYPSTLETQLQSFSRAPVPPTLPCDLQAMGGAHSREDKQPQFPSGIFDWRTKDLSATVAFRDKDFMKSTF